MKIKQVLSLSLTVLVFLPCIVIKANAMNGSLLDNQSLWPEAEAAPVKPNAAYSPTCSYYTDLENNCLYVSLSIRQQNANADAVTARAIIKTKEWRQLIDINSETYALHSNGVETQANLVYNNDGYINYTLALGFKEKTAYEITPIFIVNGEEIRLKNTIGFDSTVMTTQRETTTKAEKTSAPKKSTNKNEKATKAITQKQSAKTTTKAGGKTLNGSSESILTEEMPAQLQETIQATPSTSFFQAMSKPTRVVFIAAVILSALALLAVGMAIGNRKTKKAEEARRETEEEKEE